MNGLINRVDYSANGEGRAFRLRTNNPVLLLNARIEMEHWKEFEFGGLSYKVSDHGNIIGARGRKLSQRKNNDGYMVVTLGIAGQRTMARVHRIVAECFIPHDVALNEVNHIDFNRANNCVENLEWTTHSENVRYSYASGRHIGSLQRERNGRALLKESDIPKIKAMIADGVSNINTGKRFGVAPSTIWNIKAGNTWK